MPCRWHGEVSCTTLLAPTVCSNGHRRVGTPGSYLKPLRRSREGWDVKPGASPRSSNHLRQVVRDRGGSHGRHSVRWMKRPGGRSVHSQHGILRIRASLAKPLRYQGHPRQPIWNALFAPRPARSCLDSACDLGLMPAAGDLSQNRPGEKGLSEPAHLVSWQWDEWQAGLGLIQRGHQMGEKREISLPRE